MGMDMITTAIAVLVSVVVGGVVGFLAKIGIIGMRKKKAADDVTRMLDEADTTRGVVLLEAKEEALKLRNSAEVDIRERRSELNSRERRMANREQNLERRSDNLDKRERGQSDKERQIEEKETELEGMKHQEMEELEKISSLSASDAKDMLLSRAEDEMSYE
ncbi:uncharacterized protein METZ01_LOCUS500703, partial [marine metagenome]